MTDLPLALNPMKSKDVLAVLAERNQAVVPVGAWVEPASPNSSEVPAYTSACIIEEELKEQLRRKEEALKHFQRQVKHRVNQQIRLRKKQQLQKSYKAAGKGAVAVQSFDPAHLTPKRTSVFPSSLNAAFGSSRLPPSQMLGDIIEDGENQSELFQQQAQALSQTMKLARHRLASFKTVGGKMAAVLANDRRKAFAIQEKVKFKNPLFVVMGEKEQSQWHCQALHNLPTRSKRDLMEVQTAGPETQTIGPDTQAIKLAVLSAEPGSQAIEPEGQAIKAKTQGIMLKTCNAKLEDENIELEAQDFVPVNQAFLPKDQGILPKDNYIFPEGQSTLHKYQNQNFLPRNQHVYLKEQDILLKCQDEDFLPEDQNFLLRDQCALSKDQEDFLPEDQSFLPRDQCVLTQSENILPKCQDQGFLPEDQSFLPRDQCVLPQSENIVLKHQDQDFLPENLEFLPKDHSVIPNSQDQDFLRKEQSILPKDKNPLDKCQKQDFPSQDQKADLKQPSSILIVRQGKEGLPLDAHQDLHRHYQASSRDKNRFLKQTSSCMSEERVRKQLPLEYHQYVPPKIQHKSSRQQSLHAMQKVSIGTAEQLQEDLLVGDHQLLASKDQRGPWSRQQVYKNRSGLSAEFQASLAIHSGIDQEEEKKERQKQYLRHKRLFMDIERQQVKEQKQQKEQQKKKIEKIKKKKEQHYIEEQRILRLTSRGTPFSEQEMSDSLGQLQLEGAREKQQQREKEYVRYVEALRAQVQEKMKLYNITLPPLCFCGPGFWDAHPDTCANNCIFYKNHRAYNRALYSVISSSDVSKGHSTLRNAIHNFVSAQRRILKNT